MTCFESVVFEDSGQATYCQVGVSNSFDLFQFMFIDDLIESSKTLIEFIDQLDRR